MFPLGDIVRISCDQDFVHFDVSNPHSEIARAHVQFATNRSAGHPHTRRTGDRDLTGGCTFRQSLLSMLARAMSLHTTTALMLPKDPTQPALMEANVADLGRLTVAIAQVGCD